MADKKVRRKALKDPRPVRMKPHVYQPSKTELDAPVKIEATPNQLARAVLKRVEIVEDLDA